jgi:photosystem II stability/assembly factor-like uncharacterized protein
MRKNRVVVAVVSSVAFIAALAWFYTSRETGRREAKIPDAARYDAVALSFSAKTATEFDERLEEPKRMDEPDAFYEYHRGIRTRDGESAPSYKMNYQIVELLKAKGVSSTLALGKASSREKLNWIERGPGNVGGRTRGIIVDPDDPTFNTWFLGSVGGGVWKTTDAGQTWQELTAGLTNLATSALAMAASNPNVIYLGTGEGFGNIDQIAGNGLWKSTDRGQTWQQMVSTISSNFRHITRVIVDPQNENILLVSTNSGLHRSSDGGQNWTQVYPSTARAEQIIANPKNFKTQFATINRYGVIKSVDGGLTWRDSFRIFSGIRRAEIAMAPSDTSRLYISAEGDPANSPAAKLYISEDAGANWSLAKPEDTANIDFLGGQGWYDNTIAVHPYDHNLVFAGGVSIWKFEVRRDPPSPDRALVGIDFVNTSTFLSLTNLTGSVNGVLVGNVPTTEQVSVELRFGPGKSQKAHRFTVPAGSTSGVPDANYSYQDYIDVPFEVWDIDNNQQLMVSFRDQLNDGQFNLEVSNSARAREYVFPQAVPYATTPSPDITKNAGHTFKQLFWIWPVLPAGRTWDPANLPASTFRVRWEDITAKKVARSVFQDSYQQFGGTHKGVHPDHHNLVFIPTNPAQNAFRLLNANDGGISFSDDGGATFKQTGQGFNFPGALKGYNTSQFYGLDKMNGADRYIGGTQDNGSYFSPVDPDAVSEWTHTPGGDGFEAAWNYRDPDKMLESSQYNSIYLSVDGGINWRQVGPDRGSAAGPFFTKIAKSKQDPDLVFATGISGLWRSDNFAANWVLARMPQGFVGNSFYSQVEISLASPQVVWAGRSLSTTTPVFVSTDGGFTFTPTKTYSVNLGSVTGMATHPTDEKTAYVLFSFAGAPKVLRTTDLGQTWTELSGFGTNTTSSNGFPDVATYSLLVMPYDTNIIWAGTEIGLFESKNGGATWAYADNGLPPLSIWEMIIVNDEVVLATHGRGIWSVSLPQLAGYEPPAVILSPRVRELAGGFGGIVSATFGLASAYDSTIVLVDGTRYLKLGANSAVKDTSLQLMIPVSAPKTAAFSLMGYRDGKTFKSNPFSLQLWPLQQAQVKYRNNFDNATQAAADFGADGLVFSTPSGFANGVLNSPHNYATNRTYSAVLLTPIIVAAADATLEYQDVAIVEPGEPGSKFGDEDFYDYVVVEGSNDLGRTWRPLADGYDARADSRWLAAYDARQPGMPAMFLKHKLNLLDTFAPGDQILIRFQLFSDPGATAWGWAVDSLMIQENVTSVASSGSSLPTAFSLAQNYPNPFNPSTMIKYALPKNSDVKIVVYNAFGQQVRTLLDAKKEAGFHQIEWNGKNDAGHPVATGVYFYKLTAKDYVRTLKMLLVK